MTPRKSTPKVLTDEQHAAALRKAVDAANKAVTHMRATVKAAQAAGLEAYVATDRELSMKVQYIHRKVDL